MLANAGVFRLARTGCWSTDALLLASRFAWYTAVASSELPVASSWAPIGAEGPWRPSDEATLTASSFSAGPKTAPLRVPAPPTPPGAHASAGGPVATVSSCSLVPDTVPDTHTTRRRTTHSAHGHTKSRHVSVFAVFTRVIDSCARGVLAVRRGHTTPAAPNLGIRGRTIRLPAALAAASHPHSRGKTGQRRTARGHTSLAPPLFSLASRLDSLATSATERARDPS